MIRIRYKRSKLIVQAIGKSVGQETVPSRITLGELETSQRHGLWLGNEFSEHVSPNSSISTSDGCRTIGPVLLTIQTKVFRRCLIDEGIRASRGIRRKPNVEWDGIHVFSQPNLGESKTLRASEIRRPGVSACVSCRGPPWNQLGASTDAIRKFSDFPWVCGWKVPVHGGRGAEMPRVRRSVIAPPSLRQSTPI